MVNKVTLIGSLGKDPEVNHTPSGTSICSFSLATSEKWKDKNTGEQKEKTEWHRIKAFGMIGDLCGKYLKKGSKVFIEGKISYSSYEKDGRTIYQTDIIVNEVKFLDSKPKEQNYGNKPQWPNRENYDGYQPPPDDDIPF